MKALLLGFLAAFSLASTGCFLSLGPPRERIDLTFVNSTTGLLCYYRSPEDAAAGELCPEVAANAITVWKPSCGRKDTDHLPFTVVLTSFRSGETIYNRTANCGDWRAANATVIVKMIGGEFVVTDSLP